METPLRILQLNSRLTGGGTDDQCVKLAQEELWDLKRPTALDMKVSTERTIAAALRPGGRWLDFAPHRCILVSVRRTIDLDPETERELAQAVSLTRERQAVVLRQAIRAGLPLVQSRWQAPRPEGYFTADYPLPQDRLELEAAMAKVKQRPER